LKALGAVFYWAFNWISTVDGFEFGKVFLEPRISALNAD